MVGKLIGGRYRTLERHAVGGMATLWRARDERTGELVALKRLHPYLVADPIARERLVREMAALNAVDHQAITRPRELIDDLDDPALVMDFAEGRSLEERLASDGPFDPEEAVAIAGIVAEALAVAHGAGIVHRDVKPANILVEDSGAVHLVDFGIATFGGADEAALTVTGTMVGTLRYAAPERLAGAESTSRSDVWALGAVLFEMITGRPAVGPGDRRDDASRGVALDTDGLPPALVPIVERAMAHDPADRYSDAAAFRDALISEETVDPFADTAVVPLPQARTEGRSARPWRRHLGVLSPVDRAAAIFFGGVGAVTLAVAAALGLGAGEAGGPSSSPIPAVPAIQLAPTPTDALVTPQPDHNDEGRGNGNGKGRGRGKGNGGD